MNNPTTTIEELKATLDAWIPKYIRQVVELRSGSKLSAERYNELMNLLITQGDDTIELAQVVKQYVELLVEDVSTEFNDTTVEVNATAANAIQIANEAVEDVVAYKASMDARLEEALKEVEDSLTAADEIIRDAAAVYDKVDEINTDVKNITNGTTPVGNAQNLDGHGAEYFATSEELTAVQSNTQKNLSVSGWYRIAKSNIDYPCTLLFKIGNVYNAGGSSEHFILYSESYTNGGFATISSKSKNKQLFTKIRKVVDEDDKVYYEVYYNHDSSNPCSFCILDFSYNKNMACKIIEPVATQETVDGVTVIATYDIPANATVATDLDLANYLLKTGGVITAETYIPLVLASAGYGNSFLQFIGKDGTLGYLGFEGADGLKFLNHSGGKSYDLLHTGNKPTGTYTGNGSAEQRTIATGGIGKVLVVYSNAGIALVTPIGSMLFADGVSAFDANTKYINGTLTVASTDLKLNGNGREYQYTDL